MIPTMNIVRNGVTVRINVSDFDPAIDVIEGMSEPLGAPVPRPAGAEELSAALGIVSGFVAAVAAGSVPSGADQALAALAVISGALAAGSEASAPVDPAAVSGGGSDPANEPELPFKLGVVG